MPDPTSEPPDVAGEPDVAESAESTESTESAESAGSTGSTGSTEGPAALPEARLRSAKGLGVGYRADEVDAFVAQLGKAAEREKTTMAPYEVADARFKASRVRRRYQMQSVDEFLEQSQAVLRRRHAHDAVADVEGHLAPPRHAPTLWIYLVAFVLVALMLAFALTQI